MLDLNQSLVMSYEQKQISNLKLIADENAFTEEELAKAIEPGTFLLRASKPVAGSLRDVIVPLDPRPALDMIPLMEKNMDNMNRLMGVGPNQLGQPAGGRTTATEVEQLAARTDLRADERSHLVGNMIGNTFTKVNQIISKNWNDTILIRVIGVDAAQYFVRVKPSDLKTQMETTVDVESMQPRSKNREKREMIDLLQVIAQVPNANVFNLIQKILSNFEWADVQGLLPQATQPEVFNLEQFEQQQQGLINQQQQLGQTAQGNIQPLVNALPQPATPQGA